jgi:hypothetical protein
LKVLSMTMFNRPVYTAQVLDAMSNLIGIGEYYLSISIDPGDDEVLALARSIDFCKRSFYVNQQVLGNPSNTHMALERAFNLGRGDVDFVIHLEDDILPALDTLRYFEWASFVYRSDPDIFAICGWSDARIPSARVRSRSAVVVRLPSFSPQIWGIWRHRWEEVSPQWDHNYTHHGWDWNLRQRVRGDRNCAFPLLSRSKHIGLEKGVHTTPVTFKSDAPGAWNALSDAALWEFHETEALTGVATS